MRGGPGVQQGAIVGIIDLEYYLMYRLELLPNGVTTGWNMEQLLLASTICTCMAQQYATLAQLTVRACGSVIGQYHRVRTAIFTFCSRATHGLRQLQAAIQDDDP